MRALFFILAFSLVSPAFAGDSNLTGEFRSACEADKTAPSANSLTLGDRLFEQFFSGCASIKLAKDMTSEKDVYTYSCIFKVRPTKEKRYEAFRSDDAKEVILDEQNPYFVKAVAMMGAFNTASYKGGENVHFGVLVKHQSTKGKLDIVIVPKDLKNIFGTIKNGGQIFSYLSTYTNFNVSAATTDCNKISIKKEARGYVIEGLEELGGHSTIESVVLTEEWSLERLGKRTASLR